MYPSTLGNPGDASRISPGVPYKIHTSIYLETPGMHAGCPLATTAPPQSEPTGPKGLGETRQKRKTGTACDHPQNTHTTRRNIKGNQQHPGFHVIQFPTHRIHDKLIYHLARVTTIKPIDLNLEFKRNTPHISDDAYPIYAKRNTTTGIIDIDPSLPNRHRTC